ncbi:DNA ligase [Paenibacillus sp. HN-1]|uniref:DNA ligase n=1 Tax=Paenibacillus TaxID=44249 RepID=UPI001CAA1951|nr:MULTISPECIES: DNA ligase [Paenibacillus]MBY9081862.1 DNA ligase [Paenibacillus sp. CGMCC 1.18879]MBY9085980.1 DNA ligase [Paenibacillus sinensis]
MNIGSLIRGLLGDTKPGEAKALDLKEGQVVRGVVLSVSDSGKEAVVQIQGTPVRAELEAPVQAGQAMTLQVAPPNEEGLPVLKPYQSGNSVAAGLTMGEALETLGLTDVKGGRDIVQAMQSGGLPLTKETAAQLKTILDAKPSAVPVQEWLESAVISLKRGLPVTPESVKGIQQAVFGPPLHELLSNLEEQVMQLIGQLENEGDGAKPQTTQSSPSQLNGQAAGEAPETATATLREAKPGSASGTGNPAAQGVQDGPEDTAANGKPASPNAPHTVEGGSNAPASRLTDPAGRQQPANGAALAGMPPADTETSAGGTAAAPTGGQAPAPVPEGAAQPAAGNAAASAAAGPASAAVKAGDGGIPPEAGTLPAADADPPPEGAAARTAAAENPRLRDGAAPQDNTAPGQARPAGEEAARPAPARPEALLAKLQGVLSELRDTLPQLASATSPHSSAGAETARPDVAGQNAAAAGQPQPDQAAQSGAWVAKVLKLLGAEHEQLAVRFGAQHAEASGGAAQDSAARAADTVKGLLLQALDTGVLPPALKETAGQLVQNLTGQQLLMNTDRTAPFAQVTLFLPLKGPDGTETASVHIQSRRGRKGELDASNCRLWFDLDMQAIGRTLVDVQVVDRIVSLKLHNDESWARDLFESTRDQIQTAVEGIGYQLLSLKAEPLPVRNGDALVKVHGTSSDYIPDSYRGVDYRV